MQPEKKVFKYQVKKYIFLPIIAAFLFIIYFANKEHKPKLVVFIVLDQATPDIINKYDHLFTGGLRWIIDHGINFNNTYHEHGHTVTGPVFRIPDSGDLHMRYTIRKKNVIWIQNPEMKSAKLSLRKILDGDSSYTFRTLLKAGSGLVSNNVLHARSSFLDDETNKRHFYRSRYFDRLNGTSVLGD